MPNRIDGARLRGELVEPVGPYAQVDVVATTGSTNADLRQAVVDGAPDRTALVAAEQTAGLGRRGRTWASPGSGVYISVLLRPSGVPVAGVGSLAIAAGLAVLDVGDALGANVALKWPNDVLAADASGKCAGILSEAASSDELAVVLGIGLNVTRVREDVTVPAGALPPVSLAELGAATSDRTDVAMMVLAALHERETVWREAAGDLADADMLDEYRQRCLTLGQEVKILTGGGSVIGDAVDVEPTGALVVDVPGGTRRSVFAGDVVHLRPTGG
ncbi:BirA family transcriptional regulator, biotin operon repressor / biotin-[acetyl-CoA-carboxylase] ligase [Prauserella aidingensis]|uniref:biotin--[acetyl-CoA-carboxylase] ligase n=1 Tax=Prauserella aidingensis TaxID=387890 RepID=UPI0020A49993|nr:biotin--[acetyl-CoA-carboxylase] ligase [Prauserella aidingensis]MCP2254962.1 BirA family transcriptional regulator, biotin operon repressor / biotin-[acetyl-CoA-carboxylase] ligase [Prauserella aidingensis]